VALPLFKINHKDACFIFATIQLGKKKIKKSAISPVGITLPLYGTTNK